MIVAVAGLIGTLAISVAAVGATVLPRTGQTLAGTVLGVVSGGICHADFLCLG